jgi:hypothetical protein
MTYTPAANCSTPIAALQENFPSKAFAKFIAPMRVKAGPRGDLISLLRIIIINVPSCPRSIAWADIYHMLARRGASDETITEARILWAQFKSAGCPSAQQRGTRHA